MLGRHKLRRVIRIAFLSGILTISTVAAAQAGPSNHSATIKWKRSETEKHSHRVVKYFVYRADGVKSPDGSVRCTVDFKKIGEVESSVTSYTDNSVVAGQTYCYQVTAKAATVEGPASNSMAATIPSDQK